MIVLFAVLALSASYLTYSALRWALGLCKGKGEDDFGTLCWLFIWLTAPAAVCGLIGLVGTITDRFGGAWIIDWFLRTF